MLPRAAVEQNISLTLAAVARRGAAETITLDIGPGLCAYTYRHRPLCSELQSRERRAREEGERKERKREERERERKREGGGGGGRRCTGCSRCEMTVGVCASGRRFTVSQGLVLGFEAPPLRPTETAAAGDSGQGNVIQDALTSEDASPVLGPDENAQDEPVGGDVDAETPDTVMP
eukprot:2207091-Rhodomonas_salina.1